MDFPKPTGRVSMQDLAALTGVSVTTVSRALKDNPRLSKSTRAKVQKAARDLGYKPHPYLSALMSNLSQTRNAAATVNLAVLHFNPRENPPRDDFYRGILARAMELGYQIEPILYNPELIAPARLKKILQARGIRGIIVMPALKGFASVDFDFNGFAASTIGHTIVEPQLPRVAHDIYAGTFMALDELCKRGYRRIGMVNTEYVNRMARFLYSAAITTYKSHIRPGHHLVEYTVEEPVDSEASLKKMKQWILREKPDVVISPVFVLRLFEIFRKQGFKIPGDFAYLHLLDHPDPKVSSLGQNAEFMGAKAVDIVVAAINRNEFKQSDNPYIIATLPQWHEGKTLPSAKKNAM